MPLTSPTRSGLSARPPSDRSEACSAILAAITRSKTDDSTLVELFVELQQTAADRHLVPGDLTDCLTQLVNDGRIVVGPDAHPRPANHQRGARS